MAAFFALIVFYIGSASALLARVAGTCTQGEAGRLYGGVLTLGLYATGAVLSRRTNNPAAVLIGLAPLSPIFLWVTVFAIRFGVGYWLGGLSACDVLDTWGDGTSVEYEMDGGERELTVFWALIPLIAWATFCSLVVRSYIQWKSAHAKG